GDTAMIPVPIKDFRLADISPDHTQLMLISFAVTGAQDLPVWVLPLPAGSPRPLGNILSSSASWSNDGKQLVFVKGEALYLANADGSNPHLLAQPQGVPFLPRFSPDGTLVRFTLTQANTQSLWEVHSDGSGLHRMLDGRQNFSNE
ncbi:MAG TPA: hypothetical protein VLK33_00040, partial [Terriglobales bacterium]|nr:hypothetical protein [Terriglobales bacterium]